MDCAPAGGVVTAISVDGSKTIPIADILIAMARFPFKAAHGAATACAQTTLAHGATSLGI